MSNTSLYSSQGGNVTVPPNNNTGLYNTGTQPVPINTDINIQGNISALGNITGGNLISNGDISAVGNVYADNFVGNITANVVAPGTNTEIVFNDNGLLGADPGLTFDSTTQALSVGGNVTGNFFIGDGSQLTNLPSLNYSNANVVSLLSSFGSNVVSTTGNVTAGFFLGDGSQLTNLPAGNYSNANVAAYLPTYTGNITANVISATGNITGAFILGDGSQLTNLPAGNYSNANVAAYLPTYTGVLAGNSVSVTGNATANFFIGDGSQLTNLPAGNYSNANVAAYLPTYTGNITANVISATGNVSGSFFIGNGSQLTGIVTDYSNANVTSLLAAFGSNTISTTGTVTAGNLVGNGSQISSIAAGNVVGQVANALVAGTVYTNAQPNITSVGTLTSLSTTGTATVGNVLTAGQVSATGNITGNYIFGNGSQLTGIVTNYSNANVAAYLPVYTGDIAGGNLSVTGNVVGNILKTSGATGNIVGANYVSANFFVGDGGLLSNITSSFGNANVAAYLPTYTGNLTAGNISFSGTITGNGGQLSNITAANITGTVANATYATSAGTAATVTGNAQANITSVGTLSTLSVSNNTSGVFAATITQANATGGGLDVRSGDGTGTNTMFIVRDSAGGNIRLSVQENGTTSITNPTISLSGNVVANSLISATGNITGGNIITAGAITATGNITGSYIIGNGSQLTGLPAGYSNTDVNAHLAAFGSNVVSTTGNITASNFIGNIAAANVVGTVANATYATSAGSADTATTAGTVTSNAQGNITSVGTLTVLDVSGNVSVTGNITGNYFIGNGSQLTGLPAGYSNADVNAHLAAFGSNTISTTGNVTAGYFIGNGSQLTGITATANAGGSNTQLQFNDDGVFAGNAAMTFDKTTGLVTLGNITVGNLTLNTVSSNINTANVNVFGNNPWRMIMGNAYLGSANSIYAATFPGQNTNAMSPRLLLSDLIYIGNNTTRMQELTVQNWYVATANITNTLGRYGGIRNETMFGGGPAGNVININGSFGGIGISSVVAVGAGTNANLSAVGNTSGSNQAYQAYFANPQVNLYSSANTIIGYYSQCTTNHTGLGYGNANNQIGFYNSFGGNPANTATGTTTAIAFYNPGTSSAISAGTNGNIARNATNYYAFCNDDNLAKSRLGSLEGFHEYTSNVTISSGNVTINKNNGQVQQIYMTENVSGVTFSNFVVSTQRPNGNVVNQSDTVTLIVQQGATPYNLTLPTGNTSIRYAGNVSTVGNTANSTTMISITGVYNYNTTSTNYLITVSPEFV